VRKRQKPCRAKADGCLGAYWPRSSFQKTCSNMACILKQLEADKAKAAEKERRRQAREDHEARQRLKTYAQHANDTQDAVNAYIRELRKGEPCMSCQRPFKPGQMQYAGHYLSRGARPDRRFQETNIWLQCYSCNSAKSSNALEYRLNLVKRIGEAQVVEMETETIMESPTIKDLHKIKKLYRQKLRALKAKNKLTG